MEKNNVKEFLQMLNGLGELYGQSVSDMVAEIFWNVLKNYSMLEIKHAITQHVTNPVNGQFMPKPADLIRYLEPDAESKALRAWAEVLNAIQRIGAYESPGFEDLIIPNVISEMGGWISLCKMNHEEMPFRERDFTKRYISYVKNPKMIQEKRLVGIIAKSDTGLIGYSEQKTLPQDLIRLVNTKVAGND